MVFFLGGGVPIIIKDWEAQIKWYGFGRYLKVGSVSA